MEAARAVFGGLGVVMLDGIETGYEGKFDFRAKGEKPEITYMLAALPRTGSLEPGKSADLLILEMGDYREFLSCPGVNNVFGMVKNGVPV